MELSQTPANLSEPETAEMETYLDYALPLFPLVGVNVFESVEEPPPVTSVKPTADGAATATTTERLYLTTQLTQAEGEDQSRGFLVLEDSKGRREKMKMQRGYEQLRDTLLHEGILVEDGDHIRLVRSYLFDSPSATASVLAGATRTGAPSRTRTAGRSRSWKNEQRRPQICWWSQGQSRSSPRAAVLSLMISRKGSTGDGWKSWAR